MHTGDSFAISLLAPHLSIKLGRHKQLVKGPFETFKMSSHIPGGTLIIREMVGLKIILSTVSKIYTIRTNS